MYYCSKTFIKLLYGLHIPSGKFNLNVIDNNRFKDESVIFNNSVKNSVFEDGSDEFNV
jgi:hypothetical protein